MIDSEVREKVIASEGNMVISAGAGSGKTTLLTAKIINDVQKCKTHYKIAAITFTQKAANEIKIKLKGRINGNFIGTNDSFVEQQIIVPFLKDAYGEDYSNEFLVSYTRENKFKFYNEGLEKLKSKKILATYENNKKNFKFQLALEILKKSKVAEQYIKAKYSRLFIDEYQDCDKDMHELFMYIKELGVKLFIVGDPKQSIYNWRGASPKLFKNIYSGKNDFEKYELLMNFRCSKSIQNYSNIIQYKDISKYQHCEVNDVFILKDSDIRLALKHLNIEKEIAILVWKNEDAKAINNVLNSNGYNFTFIPKTPIDELGTNNKNILLELAKYSKNNKYTHYDFINNIPKEFSKKEILKLKNIIEPLKVANLNSDNIEKILIELFGLLGLVFNEDKEINKFIDAITNDMYINAFNGETFNHKVITIHSSKGLEFEQVVLLSSDYDIYYEEHYEEHYVATTRAKNKLIILSNKEEYLIKIKNICKDINLSLDKLVKIIK